MVFEKIQEIIADKLGLDADEITLESSIKDDLNADSLDLYEIVTGHRRRIRCGSANGSVGQHEYGQGHGRIYGIVAGIRLDW